MLLGNHSWDVKCVPACVLLSKKSLKYVSKYLTPSWEFERYVGVLQWKKLSEILHGYGDEGQM